MTLDHVCERVRFYVGLWNELPVIAQGVVVLIVSFASSFVLVIFWMLRGNDGN